MTSLLEIRGARREFVTPEGASFAALDGIDLDVGANEFVTLLGPSGCGKTTLLRTISGFEALDRGTIRLDGADLMALPPFRRPVNTVFQSYALFSHMTVARNVGYALEVRGADRATRERDVKEALEKVGLSGMGSRKNESAFGDIRCVEYNRNMAVFVYIETFNTELHKVHETNSWELSEGGIKIYSCIRVRIFYNT